MPWAGVPPVAMNTRLSAGEVAYIVEHSKASVLIHDPSFDELVDTALGPARPSAAPDPGGTAVRAAAGGGEPAATSSRTDERALLSINYTSGTTGRPKGVMYHHRGLPAGAGHGRAHPG